MKVERGNSVCAVNTLFFFFVNSKPPIFSYGLYGGRRRMHIMMSYNNARFKFKDKNDVSRIHVHLCRTRRNQFALLYTLICSLSSVGIIYTRVDNCRTNDMQLNAVSRTYSHMLEYAWTAIFQEFYFENIFLTRITGARVGGMRALSCWIYQF